MKRFFLLLIACLALSATQAAGPRKLVPLRPRLHAKAARAPKKATIAGLRPAPRRIEAAQGEAMPYNLSATYVGDEADSHYNALAAEVTIEGNVYTIKGLFPDFPDALCTGTLDDEGLITFDQDFVCTQVDWTQYGEGIYDLHLGTPVLDEEGYITGVKAATFSLNELGYLESDPNEYVMLYSNDADGNFEYYWSLGYYFTLMPLDENDLQAVALPDGVEAQEYIYTVQDLGPDGSLLTTIDSLAIDGADYYLHGVVEGWIKGTREGNKVTFPADQYLGAPEGSRLYFYAGIVGTNPETGNYAVTALPESLDFTIDDDGTLHTDGDSLYALTLTAANELYAYVHNIVIKPYAGDVLATPTDPVYYDYDFNAEEAFYDYISYDTYNEGLNGEFLNPARMYTVVYYDDEPYTFDPEFYTEDYNFTEPMTEVPYAFNDYDFYSYGSYHQIYLGDKLFEKIGIQSVYYCEGQRKVSNIVYLTPEGDITTEYVADAADYRAMLQQTLNEALAIDFDALDELTASALNVAESHALDVLTATTSTIPDYIEANDALHAAIDAAKAVRELRATGITGPRTLDARAIYNLQGQRVTRATKGLYIVGGKKVAVK